MENLIVMPSQEGFDSLFQEYARHYPTGTGDLRHLYSREVRAALDNINARWQQQVQRPPEFWANLEDIISDILAVTGMSVEQLLQACWTPLKACHRTPPLHRLPTRIAARIFPAEAPAPLPRGLAPLSRPGMRSWCVVGSSLAGQAMLDCGCCGHQPVVYPLCTEISGEDQVSQHVRLYELPMCVNCPMPMPNSMWW